MTHKTRKPAVLDPGGSVPPDARSPYAAPEVHVLGTLAELTAGGTDGPDDGFGGAGDAGSL
jgi:hypothetical protein